MRVVDLFSGCGGMSLGFQNVGFEIVAAFDNWEPALNTYKRNFDHPIYDVDLGAFNGDASEFIGLNPDMVIGGPPCQDFSSAGKRDETLGRADLTIYFANIVKAISPKWFVMENVDRALKSRAYNSAREILRQSGYGTTEVVLDASLCGVPQTRKRLFLIGRKGGEDNEVKPYLAKNLARHPMTLREYFGNWLGIDHYYRHPRSYQRRGIFSVDEPSPTIRGVNRPIPSTYQMHPGDTSTDYSKIRPLTTKERWMIQTFPEDFKFVGTKTEIEQLVGNAVPVKLAEYVASCILEFIDNPSDTSSIEKDRPGYQASLFEV